MREFFRTKRFKILLAVFVALLMLMLYSAATGNNSNGVLSIITSPVQKLSSWISGAATDFFGNIANSGKNARENAELRKEVTSLREQLIDYENTKDENEQLKEMMGIKNANPEQELEAASVIGRDADDRYGSFQIDKGSANGIELYDPVITSDGLVGYITKVGVLSSRVTTLLSPDINVGAYGIHSGETGVITGEPSLSQDGFCKLRYLLRESAVAKGELVITSGLSGIFPKGLIIGTVEKLTPEAGGASVYAVVKPAAQIEETKGVFVIKSFTGQGVGEEDTDDKKSTDTSSTASSAAQEE